MEQTVGAIWTPSKGVLGGKFGETPLGATGVLHPGMEALIVKEDRRPAGVNESGELWLRGRNIALGYWNNEKADRETFVDGWLHTGDIFRVDEKGFFLYRFQISGDFKLNFCFNSYEERGKDILKVSGMQVSPSEIENVLLAQPDKYIIDASVASTLR